MLQVLKNHSIFALVLIMGVIATILSTIASEQTIGLHAIFGRAGDAEIVFFGTIYAGTGTYLATQYLKKNESVEFGLLDQHIGSVGLFYLLIVFVFYQIYNIDGTGGLTESYYLLLLFSLIVLVATNLLALVAQSTKVNNHSSD